jgi:ATP-binding protein involved in chromosome partitioning
MAYFVELPDNKYFIFGSDGGPARRKHNVHFLGQIPIVQSIREEGGDEGRPM